MATVVEICNFALSDFGARTIESIDEPIEEARQCKVHFNQCRKALISGQYDWSFTRKRQALASLVNDRDQVWGFCYSVPNDLNRLCYVEVDQREPVPPVRYEIIGTKLYCDVEAAWIVYTADVTDPQKFTTPFVEALWPLLASRIVYPLTKDGNLKRAYLEAAARARSFNETIDANNDLNLVSTYSEFEAARVGNADSTD